MKPFFYLIASLLFFTSTSYGQWRFCVESGAVFTQYNKVQAPNSPQNKGDRFSLVNNFSKKPIAPFFRAEVRYLWRAKHSFEITAAPLTVNYGNLSSSSINFENQTFNSNSTQGSYEFNTYRLAYRYRLVNQAKLKFDLGASLLVRDARIALKNANQLAENTDLGFVPLLSFELTYISNPQWQWVLKGDALYGTQGRAEDVFAGFFYQLGSSAWRLKAGYRLIEGGADVDQVYNFAYFHFVNVGLVYTL